MIWTLWGVGLCYPEGGGVILEGCLEGLNHKMDEMHVKSCLFELFLLSEVLDGYLVFFLTVFNPPCALHVKTVD